MIRYQRSMQVTAYSLNDADLIISQTHGERNLIADVWDAVAGLNRGGISGRLTIYAIPLSTSVRENSAL